MVPVLAQRFPHIVTRLTEVWLDGQQAIGYLDALLFKESVRVERHGFTEDTWMELTFLKGLLLEEYPPQASMLGTDVWATAADAAPTTS